MNNRNVFTGSGNVVEKPTLRKAGEHDVCTVRVAINNTQEDVLYIDVECWRKNAEFASKYFEKGSRVGVVGQLKQRTYTNKEDQKVTKYFVDSTWIGFDGPPAKKDGESEEKESAPAAPSKKQTAAKPSSKDDSLPF